MYGAAERAAGLARPIARLCIVFPVCYYYHGPLVILTCWWLDGVFFE